MSPEFLTPAQVERLEQSAIIWLASVRPNAAPHLIPIWFVWSTGKAYVCTSSRSVKARNMARNERVAFALEDGTEPLIVEGTAQQLNEIPPAIAALFEKKYDWDIASDNDNDALIEISPVKVL